jgi:hypothetical protein
MALQKKRRHRSCLTAASRPRFPLQERPNLPSATPPKKKIFLAPTESSFPCPEDPVPDALIDYTELWKAVSMAKQPDTAQASGKSSDKGSTKGTEAYGDVLYHLGIDVDTAHTVTCPEEVIDLGDFISPATVDYPNLKTDEQLQELADKHKQHVEVPNEATMAARLMSQIFPFVDIPVLLSSERSTVPCQVLEFRSAFTGFDRFNASFYNYVRGPKKERDISPTEGDLRSRSDLTIMAYKTAISKRFRKTCNDYPGVHKECSAIAPFLSIEFKVSNDSAKVRESDTLDCYIFVLMIL